LLLVLVLLQELLQELLLVLHLHPLIQLMQFSFHPCCVHGMF
jgi:hypothetical protein